MTPEQFGQTIKMQYPQYQSVPDAELGNAMLQKYPQYQQVIAQEPMVVRSDKPRKVEQFLSGQPILKTIGDAIGGTSWAKATAQGIFFNFTKEGKDVLKRLEQGKMTWDEVETILGPFATNREVIASAAQTAATIATAGLGAAKGVTAGARIAKTAGKLGGVSAVSGGAQTYGEGGDTADIAQSAGVSGALGAGFGVAGGALGELGKLLASSKVTEGLYNKALGISKKTVEQGKSPAKTLIKEGISGTKQGMLSRSKELANASEKTVSEILRSNTAKVSSENVMNQIRERLTQTFKNTLEPSEIEEIITKLPVSMLRRKKAISIAQLNDLRREIDNKFLGSTKWMNNSTAERIIGLKSATNVMRGMVQQSDERLPEIFSRYADAITAIRALNSELAKPHIMTGFMELLIGGGLGGLTGLAGGSPSTIANAAIGIGLYKARKSAPVRTGVARGLTKAGKAVKGKTSQAIRSAAQTAAQAISREAGNLTYPQPQER